MASPDDPMPVWKDESHIDIEWLRQRTQLPCLSCTVQDISNETRRSVKTCDGSTLRLRLELGIGETKFVILKQVPSSGTVLSQQLGLAREALFYDQLSSDMNAADKIIPGVIYAWGNMKSGAKVVLMEDLSETSVDSGVFFGPGNPNNWDRDLEVHIKKSGPHPPSATQVARITFQAMAKVHATFWRRQDLLDPRYHWLRGHQWLLGEGKESWEASQSLVKQYWQACVDREQEGGQSLQWDPIVKEAVQASVKGISWEAQRNRLRKDGRWTLVHGDFWPGNCMWMIHPDSSSGSIRLLDWEMVGLGSGPQDLGQYILSNMDPTERRESERSLVETYYNELRRCGVEDVDWDYCWSEYKMGGLERWLWFLIYFAGQEGTLNWAQFFHNQIASFMHDHQVSAAHVVQPRP